MEKEKLRVDKYLWAIRLFKTRALAAEACEKNKVRLNANPVKAAKNVHIDDEFEVKTEARKWIIKVTGLLYTRVQYVEAVKYYIDLTPAEELIKDSFQGSSFHTGKRLSKVGRPTKKEKRKMDDFFGKEENPES